MNRRFLWVFAYLLAFMLGWLLAGKAHAATMTTRCVVGNKQCFVIRAGSRGISPTSRMCMINDRLAGVLGSAKPGDVRVERTTGSDYCVFVKNTLVVTTTSADSLANGSVDTKDLAKVWANNLASALTYK